MPQIINLLSNIPTYILESIIKENTNSLLNSEIKKANKSNRDLYTYRFILN